MQYSDAVWRYFESPRGVGELAPPEALSISPDIGAGEAGSIEQKALIRLQLRFDQQGIAITDARFKAYGCGSTIACGAWLCEWSIGKTATEAAALGNADIAAALQLSALKIYCAVVAERALRLAVNDYLTKQRA